MIRVNGISHVQYPVEDVARSVEFLTSTFGFYLQQRGSITYIGMGDTLLEVVQARPGTTPDTLYAVGVSVNDLDAALSVDDQVRGLGRIGIGQQLAKLRKPIVSHRANCLHSFRRRNRPQSFGLPGSDSQAFRRIDEQVTSRTGHSRCCNSRHSTNHKFQ